MMFKPLQEGHSPQHPDHGLQYCKLVESLPPMWNCFLCSCWWKFVWIMKLRVLSIPVHLCLFTLRS